METMYGPFATEKKSLPCVCCRTTPHHCPIIAQTHARMACDTCCHTLQEEGTRHIYIQCPLALHSPQAGDSPETSLCLANI